MHLLIPSWSHLMSSFCVFLRHGNGWHRLHRLRPLHCSLCNALASSTSFVASLHAGSLSDEDDERNSLATTFGTCFAPTRTIDRAHICHAGAGSHTRCCRSALTSVSRSHGQRCPCCSGPAVDICNLLTGCAMRSTGLAPPQLKPAQVDAQKFEQHPSVGFWRTYDQSTVINSDTPAASQLQALLQVRVAAMLIPRPMLGAMRHLWSTRELFPASNYCDFCRTTLRACCAECRRGDPAHWRIPEQRGNSILGLSPHAHGVLHSAGSHR